MARSQRNTFETGAKMRIICSTGIWFISNGVTSQLAIFMLCVYKFNCLWAVFLNHFIEANVHKNILAFTLSRIRISHLDPSMIEPQKPHLSLVFWKQTWRLSKRCKKILYIISMKDKGKMERWSQENSADHSVSLVSVKGAREKRGRSWKSLRLQSSSEKVLDRQWESSDDCHRGVDIREECLDKHPHLRLSLPSSYLGRAQPRLKHCSRFQVFCS